MISTRVVWITLVAAVGLCSCQSARQSPVHKSIAATDNDSHIAHVVLCWLKEPGNVQARQRVIDESKKLGEIPSVLHVMAGTAIPSSRPVVDSSFDVGLVFTFRNQQDLRAYLTNARHQQLLLDTIKPLVQRYIVYDIRE